MKFIIPKSEITLRVHATSDTIGITAGEIRLPEKTWVLEEEAVWTVPVGNGQGAPLLDACGYLSDLDGKLVLLVDEVYEGEQPFNPSEALAKPMWLVFQASRSGDDVTIILHEPVAPPQPQMPEEEEDDG